MAPPDALALAYCAGIIDGEGSIAMNRVRRRRVGLWRRPVVQVAMTAEPVVRFLHETFGVGYVGFRPRRTTDMWEWRASGRHAVDVLALVHPFLREPRKVARANFILSPAFVAEQSDKTFTSPEKESRRERFYASFHSL